MLKEIFPSTTNRSRARSRAGSLLNSATAKLAGTNLTDEDLLSIDTS